MLGRRACEHVGSVAGGLPWVGTICGGKSGRTRVGVRSQVGGLPGGNRMPHRHDGGIKGRITSAECGEGWRPAYPVVVRRVRVSGAGVVAGQASGPGGDR